MFRSSSSIWVIDSFLDPESCRDILRSIQAFRETTKLPEIYRQVQERSLHYSVIHGLQIVEHFAEIQTMYDPIKRLAMEKSGLPLTLMKNAMVGVNINITPPGGEYRWHYDRNALTAILFLNRIKGGETEVYPGYRLKLKNRKHSAAQKLLDAWLMKPWMRRLLGKKISIEPEPGKMLLMRGDECLHSVRAVEGAQDRVNVIFSFESPGDQNPQEAELNDYLYTTKASPPSDPNYLA